MDPEYLFKDDKYEIDPSAYLCPEPSSELIIRGNFYSQDFEYIKVVVTGCDYEDQSLCASPKELD